MELATKGASAPMLGGLASFVATLTWTSSVDFDLMLFCRTAGSTGNQPDEVIPVYYNNQSAPGIVLSEDAGVGDQGGNNTEQVVITDLSHWSEVYICVADYGAINESKQARFDSSDVKIELLGLDAQGQTKQNNQVKPTAGMLGNICCIAKLHQRGSMWMLENVSEATGLKGLNVTGFLQQIGAYR